MSAVSTADREIKVSRTFDAPRELVWKVWTDTNHVTNWWGPRGFSTTTSEIMLAPGGVWKFVMHGPDGTNYKNKVVFIEVREPERLVYDHGGEDETADISFRATITFADVDGKTEVTLHSVFPTAEELRRVSELGAVEGAHETLERFGEYLATRI